MNCAEKLLGPTIFFNFQFLTQEGANLPLNARPPLLENANEIRARALLSRGSTDMYADICTVYGGN